MNNSVVFVIGITGFVGQNLTDYLANNFDLRCISRKGKASGLTLTTFFR